MSSQKNNIKDFVKKALVSTSMAATMLTAESAFGTSTFINRNVIGNNADLASGTNLDGSVPYSYANSLLTVPGTFTSINASVPLINSIYLTDKNVTMIFPNDITIGSIVPPALDQADTSLQMFITNGSNVTLNGTAPTLAQAQGAVDISNNSSPFAPGLGSNVPTYTYFLYNVDFGNNGILTINAPKATEQDNNEIDLTADTKQTTVTNAAAATLNVITDFQVCDATWSTVGTTNISDGATYKFIRT